MKIVAFGASNSTKSINQQLAAHAARVYKDEFAPEADIEILDLNDFEMPIFSTDREAQSGIEPKAHEFLSKIGTADKVIISYAEHNGNYTAAFKNIFDWASRIAPKVFQKKPLVALSTSPGPGGAASVLNLALTSAPHFEADIKGSLSIGSFYDVFDQETQSLKDPELAQKLRQALSQL